VHDEIDRVLFTEQEIERAIERVATEITRAYTGVEFTVMAVLKGSCIFAADLVRAIPIPLSLSFVFAESYRAGTSAGTLSLDWLQAERAIRGRRVLLVDDIVDSGRTLATVRDELLRRGAAQLEVCVFLDKPTHRAVELDIAYRCFEVEDVFVVGYGLDHAGRHRNLPYVGALREPRTTTSAGRE
jgi:hypoxanthine phosphoribosyltransferase